MPEVIVDLLSKIEAVRGREYVAGMVDMANLLAPSAGGKEDSKEV